MDDSDPYSILKIAASIKVGRGLVEIVALATLIGSSTASDLILGNKGAAGLVWGSISAFGCSSVIKACASAASTGWLRQMLGLRTGLSDKTFGMDLSLAPKSKVARRMRGMLDTPLGVSCNSNVGSSRAWKNSDGSLCLLDYSSFRIIANAKVAKSRRTSHLP